MRVKGHQTGSSENDVLIQMIQVVLTEAERCSHCSELFALLPHLLHGPFIAGRHVTAVIQKQLDKRLIAHADTDDCYAFVF